MLRTTIGILLATVLMYVFGALYWSSPFPGGATRASADDAQAQRALAEHFPEPGTYFVPSPHQDEATFMSLHEKGPIALLNVATGAPVMQPSVFIKGLVHEIVVVALIAVLLGMAAPALKGYGHRVGFVALAGLIGSLWVHGTSVVWWYVVPDFPIRVLVYDVIAWTLVGLVLAKTVRAR